MDSEDIKTEEPKKEKLHFFRKVNSISADVEMIFLAIVCTVIFGFAFFGSAKILYDYSQKKEKSFLSIKPQMQIVTKAIAADSQPTEGNSSVNGEALSDENVDTMFVEVSDSEETADASAQTQAETEARKIAAQKAHEMAIINSAPVLAGRTNKLPNGLRVCPVKSDDPQRGHNYHVDEDCCADYNEYPNPRCYYPPKEWAILKH